MAVFPLINFRIDRENISLREVFDPKRRVLLQFFYHLIRPESLKLKLFTGIRCHLFIVKLLQSNFHSKFFGEDIALLTSPYLSNN